MSGTYSSSPGLPSKVGGYHAVTAANGEECLDVCMAELQKQAKSFDAVVLDLCPKMVGMEPAKSILATNPSQRIIFASAYVNETLVDSVKQLKQIVELLQKPFGWTRLWTCWRIRGFTNSWKN
jgi:CheY-like chemotaxis protein